MTFELVDRWLVGFLTAQVVLLGYFWFSSTKRRKRRGLGRQWSFTSRGMALGSFPTRARVPEHIINAGVFFQKSDPAASPSCPTDQAVADHVIRPLLEYERLARVPDPPHHGTRPSRDGIVQPRDLLRRIVIRGDDQATYDAIMEHLQDPLTKDRPKDLPWWEILLLENTGAGRSVMVLRVHHSVADGISLVRVFSNGILTDVKTGEPVPASPLMMQRFTDDKLKKKNTEKKTYSWTSIVSEAANILGLGATKYDSDTAFSKNFHSKMVHTQVRSAILFPPAPVSLLKKIKDAAKVTINDVILTAMSQAIHDYCVEQECPIVTATVNNPQKRASLQCRALLPVALPRRSNDVNDPASALSNQFVMLSSDIALGAASLQERLHQVRANMQAIKESPRAGLQLVIQNNVLPLVPTFLGRESVMDIFTRHSMVFANVPGPTAACRIAGCITDEVQSFYGNLIHQISFLSYNGQVFGNLITDPKFVPHGDRLAAFYGKALVDLAALYQIQEVPENLRMTKS